MAWRQFAEFIRLDRHFSPGMADAQSIFRLRHTAMNGSARKRAINIGKEARSDENGRRPGPTNKVPRRMLYQLNAEDTIVTATDNNTPARRFGVRVR